MTTVIILPSNTILVVANYFFVGLAWLRSTSIIGKLKTFFIVRLLSCFVVVVTLTNNFI